MGERQHRAQTGVGPKDPRFTRQRQLNVTVTHNKRKMQLAPPKTTPKPAVRFASRWDTEGQ